MRRPLIFLLSGLMAVLSSQMLAGEPPSILPDEATTNAWLEDLKGADEAKRKTAVARIRDTLKRYRHLEPELRRSRQTQVVMVAQNEGLTRELNSRHEKLQQKDATILKLEQQLLAMKNEERRDFRKAFDKAKEQVKKSGDAKEKAALLEVENQRLKEVFVKERRREWEARMNVAGRCEERLSNLEHSLLQGAIMRVQGKDFDLARQLTPFLRIPEWNIQARAAHMLGRMHPPARSALSDLRQALKAESGLVRAVAADAIWLIEKKKDAVLPAMLDLLVNDRQAGHAAVPVLSAIGRQDSSVVEPIAKLLEDPKAEVVLAAVRTLQAIGPNAKSAIPKLEATAKDKRELVSKAAQQALEEINKGVEEEKKAPPVPANP